MRLELLTKVLGAGDVDPDLRALSPTPKTKLGLSDLKKPPATLSREVELLTREVKSCRRIRSTPMDSCPSPFHPRVRNSVAETPAEEMGGFGLAALAPLATVTPSPPPVESGRGTKAIATAINQIELLEVDPKNLPKWAKESSEFLLLL